MYLAHALSQVLARTKEEYDHLSLQIALQQKTDSKPHTKEGDPAAAFWFAMVSEAGFEPAHPVYGH